MSLGCIRSTALKDTNIVESQNRRGHMFCGINQAPVFCVENLIDLDLMSISIETSLSKTQKVPSIRSRARRGHTLAPSRESGYPRGKRLPEKQPQRYLLEDVFHQHHHC